MLIRRPYESGGRWTPIRVRIEQGGRMQAASLGRAEELQVDAGSGPALVTLRAFGSRGSWRGDLDEDDVLIVGFSGWDGLLTGRPLIVTRDRPLDRPGGPHGLVSMAVSRAAVTLMGALLAASLAGPWAILGTARAGWTLSVWGFVAVAFAFFGALVLAWRSQAAAEAKHPAPPAREPGQVTRPFWRSAWPPTWGFGAAVMVGSVLPLVNAAWARPTQLLCVGVSVALVAAVLGTRGQRRSLMSAGHVSERDSD